MVNKLVVSAVAIFLVVGVVIGILVVVQKTNGREKEENGDKDLTSSNKMVNSMCSVTDEKKLCVNTLDKANSSNDPKDYYKIALEATIEAVKASLDSPDTIIKKMDFKNTTKENRVKMALESCKELLKYAIQDLEDSFKAVNDSDIKDSRDRMRDVNTLLTAVATQEYTCTDQLEESPEAHKEMQNGITNATKLTDISLALVAKFEDILGKIKFKLDSSHNSRMLESQVCTPTWAATAGRMLQERAPEKPNAVVAQDGSGDFKTILEALQAYPVNSQGRYVIYVKEGTYKEDIVVDKKMNNILMYGDGSTKTIVTGDKSFAKGIPTISTATFTVLGDGFVAKDMAFENTAGSEGHQAVALRVNGDMSIFYNCRIIGYQDTLYIHTKRQFYRDCEISGTVDFIFGNAEAVIQNCKIVARKPGPTQSNLITAHGKRTLEMNSGVVIHNCGIVGEPELDKLANPTFLGRPWKMFATTIFMENDYGDLIQPEGWKEWDGAPQHNDGCNYAEYNNVGPSADTSRRVQWKGVKRTIPKNDALLWTVQNFIKGDTWIPPSGVPSLPLLKD